MPRASLHDVLHQLMHSYRRQLRQGIQQHHLALPVTHIRMLKVICRIPNTTARQLAQRMGQDKARVTRVLNELMNEGLIEKSENPADRRSQFLAPTPAGLEVLKQIAVLEDDTAARLAGQLSEEEVETFTRIASTMIDNVAELDAADMETSEGTSQRESQDGQS